MPEEEYVELILSELNNRSSSLEKKDLTSIYFGGGTPSLLPAKSIVDIIDQINRLGFNIRKETEITVEINPGTLDTNWIETCLSGGVNRFSVGAQTFDPALLKTCDRIHSVEQTHETLSLLDQKGLNYSFDLLYALPRQTKGQLAFDLEQIAKYNPSHISAYCLTVPEGHPMSFHRPEDDVQVEMSYMIEQELDKVGIHKYEISNFARPGYHSKHNSLYWSGDAFWGLGLSAHSHLPRQMSGIRFWNPKDFKAYIKQAQSNYSSEFYSELPSNQFEVLKENEFLTDFCHMSLRRRQGILKADLENKLSGEATSALLPRLRGLIEKGWLNEAKEGWSLSKAGELLSNQVFSELTFMEDEPLGEFDT